MRDLLTIEDLELSTRIGIAAEERKVPQRVLVTITMELAVSRPHSDDLSQSIDYAAVAGAVQTLAITERKTIESLAEEIASVVLKQYGGTSVRVTVKKFALPGCAATSLTLERP